MALSVSRLREACADADAAPWIRVTIVETRGSTPREVGASMLVGEDSLVGTIGGGALEHRAIEAARGLLREPGGDDEAHFALGARLGQCCGGQARLWFEHRDRWCTLLRAAGHDPAVAWVAVGLAGSQGRMLVSAHEVIGSLDATVDAVAIEIARTALHARRADAFWHQSEPRSLFFEVLAPDDFGIWIFGAGHVAQACARVLSTLPLALTVLDDRPELLAPMAALGVRTLFSRALPQEVAQAPPQTCFVVMTYSHDLDARICEEVLRRGDYRYLGLIGSRAKRASFEKRFRKRGLGDALIATMVCPIGAAVPTGGLDKEPGVIALGLAAQLLELRSTCL